MKLSTAPGRRVTVLEAGRRDASRVDAPAEPQKRLELRRELDRAPCGTRGPATSIVATGGSGKSRVPHKAATSLHGSFPAPATL